LIVIIAWFRTTKRKKKKRRKMKIYWTIRNRKNWIQKNIISIIDVVYTLFTLYCVKGRCTRKFEATLKKERISLRDIGLR
jgi:hypothetical protein